MTDHWSKKLPYDACGEALRWAQTQPDPQTAWDVCERGDWMLWLLARVGVDHRTLVLATCECARLALPHVPAGEDRPLIAIETAERWARGKDGSMLEVVSRTAAAAYAAYAAAYAAAEAAADAAATVYVADAAAAAASASATAARAAAYAAYAAAYAAAEAYTAYADADAAYADAAAYTLRQCAEIVRRHFPEPPEL